MEENKDSSPAIGPEKIEQAKKEKQIVSLLEIAREKGILHALEVAKKLEDLYALGRFFEDAGRALREREWVDLNKDPEKK